MLAKADLRGPLPGGASILRGPGLRDLAGPEVQSILLKVTGTQMHNAVFRGEIAAHLPSGPHLQILRQLFSAAPPLRQHPAPYLIDQRPEQVGILL